MSPTFARFLFSMFALAAIPTAVAAADTSDGRITDYRFDDDQVFGEHPNPDGEVLRVRTRDQRESLIRARMHFVPELLKSVENL